MDGFPIPGRQHLPAVLLGLATAAALYVPPLSPASRLDWNLYDRLARQALQAAPDDIVVLHFSDPAWLDTLLSIAENDGARLVLTTDAQPPSPRANDLAFGPTELPLSASVLRRTQWRQGGHLWFRDEIDGVVRRDWTIGDEPTAIKSLAQAAADHLGRPAPAHMAATGRHWPRFAATDSFKRLAPQDLQTQPGKLHGKIVVAGSSATLFQTPLGPMKAPDLVAQMLAARISGAAIGGGPLAHAASWLAAIVLVALLLNLRAAAPVWRAVWTVAAASGLAATAAVAFLAANLALPIVAPAAFVLVTGGLAARRSARASEAGGHAAPSPVDARRLTAEGRLLEAASAYHAMPPSPALLPELYDLATALETHAHTEHAVAVWHRMAQIDVRYRDVAKRLARNARSETAEQPATPSLLDTEPATLGRYELLELLGHGTTGQVYLGRDPKINRLLAIKVINLRGEPAAQAADLGEHLCREVESAGRLNHPNIVTIYDVGEAQGLAYIAMEYLKGRHLSDFTDEATLLDPARVVDLMARTADALHYAHGHNVVHRDIKPANIMYDSILDELKITDFGIARLIDVSRTRTGIVLGTPSYMAPEQLEGENVNGHTDLFALGVTLYQLLTGRLPFRGASMTKLMFVIANEPHLPVTALCPGLPAGLSSIVDKALAKKPSERYGTGAEMADALRAVSAKIV